jgi:hypothetical protein
LKLLDQLCTQITQHEQSMHIEVTDCQRNIPTSEKVPCAKTRTAKKRPGRCCYQMTPVNLNQAERSFIASSQDYWKVTRETCFDVRQTLKEKSSLKRNEDGLQTLGKKLTKKSPFPTYRP